METVFRLKASELDNNFLQSLKALFKKKEIEISVSTTKFDETEFLLGDPVNRKHLLNAVENIRKNKNLIHFTGYEFEKLTKELLKK